MNAARVLFMPILAVMFISCTYNTGNDIKVLKQAGNILESHPDSALALLNTIQFEEGFSDGQKAEFHLLKVMAKDKCYEDISSDTVIFKVNEYYKSKRDNVNIARSALYSGLVLLEREKDKDAMQMLLEAELYINKCPGRYSLKGLIQSGIGDLFYQDLLEDEAIKRYRLAAMYFKYSGKYENEAISYNQIGLCLLMEKSENDSASYYLQKGLQIADQSNDMKLKSGFRLNLGLLWRENENPDRSIGCFKDALNYTKDDGVIAKIYYNIAKVYLSENNMDSAQYFMDKTSVLAQSGNDIHIKKYLNELDSKILKSKGNYKEALALNEEFLDYMEQEYLFHENKSVLDIEKKYNYELIRNKHNALLIKNQKWIIIFLAALILLIALIVAYYIKFSRNKKALEEAEQKIMAFTDMVERYKMREEVIMEKDEAIRLKDKKFLQKEEAFKAVLFEHFNILKKAALLEGLIKKEDKDNGSKLLRKFNEIIYGKEKLDWNILYDAMNKLHNGFLDALHNAFPELDEEEFKVCCLIYNDFSNTEISITCGLSNRTITARRTSIRRKIGIEDYGNISEFLKKHVKY